MLLALNAGSSSLKFALFTAREGALLRQLHGQIEAIGVAPHLVVSDAAGAKLLERRWSASEEATHETILPELLAFLEAQIGGALDAIGHRVVHGGAGYTAPVLLTDADVEALDALTPLAPLHQPHSVAAIRAARAARPSLPQIACFDTAFHSTMPQEATRLALPEALVGDGVRRYGFHGLSYAYIARELRRIDPNLASGRVLVGHLGNGASLCALVGGLSVETTMGFTALEGLVMGTRPGTIDPGVILYLLQQKQMSAEAIETLLYRQSGLLALSGVSSDMRQLLASDDPRARAAVEQFTYRAAREAGGLIAAMGGVDGVVFTAGIGEHASPVRAAICARLGWLGLHLDEAANRAHAPIISAAGSAVRVRVMATDEEQMIAQSMRDLLAEAR